MRARCFALSTLLCLAASVSAENLQIRGQLALVPIDTEGGVFSATPAGTQMTGQLDDATFVGSLSDGVRSVAVSCCIAAGGLGIQNNEVLQAQTAGLLNSLGGSFDAGETVDSLDIEADATTSTGGRIEIGISVLLNANTFPDASLSNYPPNGEDVRLALFFIAEFNSAGENIYLGLGVLRDLPYPISGGGSVLRVLVPAIVE